MILTFPYLLRFEVFLRISSKLSEIYITVINNPQTKIDSITIAKAIHIHKGSVQNLFIKITIEVIIPPIRFIQARKYKTSIANGL